jgi:hypothetical protein
MRDHTPEHGTLDGGVVGNVHSAAELQEIDVVDRDASSRRHEPPQRASCSQIGVPVW